MPKQGHKNAIAIYLYMHHIKRLEKGIQANRMQNVKSLAIDTIDAAKTKQ